ncbi:hypothetical protein Ddc_10014 [Ditylenchus destructor]|nr:hypothetical protein Ddc_10014 [Ditylenchus destructor]
MSQDSFIFNFNVKEFETAQEFPKSNVVELEGSKWYLAIEKKAINDRISLSYGKILDICLSCERGTPSGIYLVNLALILRGSLIDVLFTRTYYFKPLDLELHCFKIDYNYLLDNDNGFIDENGEGNIMAEISVKRVNDKEILELDAYQEKCSCLQELNGSINLQGGHRMFVNKELLSRHSKYFDNIFNNENFVESSQESIDLTDFTYNQFRLLHKHINETHPQFTDGSLEYRLKSKDGVKEFQRLCSLDDVRDYCQLYTKPLHQISEDSSKNLLKETLCMFDDLKQMSALTGLIFGVFTDCWRREHQTVSAENIEDLLSVGSYFQISKIVDSCKEFLGRNTFYPDYSVRSRLELAEKYNLTSVTAPTINPVNPLRHQWNTDSARLTPIVLVQFTFLDTGEERVCSVKFIDGMTVQTLLFNAFIELNYKRDYAACFRPSEYKVENMRISDPETYWEVEYQSKDIDDNPPPALMLDYAHSSRIYNFELRRIQKQSIGMSSTSSVMSQQLLTVQPAVQFLISKEEYPISEENSLASTIEPSTSKPGSFSERSVAGSSVLVRVTFLDNGNVQLCSVPHHTGMIVENLFSLAILTLYTRDKANRIFHKANMIYQPSNYEIEAVRAQRNQSGAVPFDVPYPYSELALTTYMYSFAARLKTLQELESSYQDLLKLIASGQQILEDIPGTSKQSTNVPSLKINDTQRILPGKSLPDILVYVIFLDTGADEMCAVPYQTGMSIQRLLCDALRSLYFKKKSCSPLDYKIERVRISIPDSPSGDEPEASFLDFQAIMFRYVLPSQIYTFEVRQKTEKESLESKEMPTTSKVLPLEIHETQKSLPDKSLPDILVHVTFLDTGVDEMCAVPYQYGMSIESLLSDALTSLYFKNKSSSPLDYKLERVATSIPDSTPGGQPEASFLNVQCDMFGYVLTSQIYKFEVRLKTEENYLGLKEMPTNSKMSPTEARNADRMPTEILVVLNFLDINDQKFCNVPYKTGMSVQNLLFIAFLTLKDSRSPFEYEIENVYVYDSNSSPDIEPHSLRPQDIETISVNSSYSYSFDMRRKTDEPSTSNEKQQTSNVL